MPTTYEDLYERDKTIYKKGVDGGLDTPYATPEQLGLDLGIGSDQIDWGAIGQYAPPPEAPPGATAEDILGGDAYGDKLAGAETDYYKTLTPEYRQQTTAQAESDVMKKFQQEIDALEAERAAARSMTVLKYGQIGEARQGTSTAIQARRGLVGSTFGSQQKSEMATQTQREQDAALAYLSAQYSERKSTLMGNIRTAQADEAKLRIEASQLDSQAKIEEIRGRKTRQDEKVSNAIKNLLSMEADTEDEELMNEVAEGLGISVKDLMSKYETIKAEAEAELFEAEQKQIDIELKRDKTKAEIEKINKDLENMDKKFEQDKLEFGMEYAMKEKRLALDTYKAQKTGRGGSGGGEDDDKTVKWSQWVEDAGLTGKPQWMVDDIFNLTTPPDWFSQSMEQEFQMSKDWGTEWTEERNKVLAIRKGGDGEEDGFSFTKLSQGARNAGMTIEEFKKLDIDTQNSYMEEF